MVQEPERGLSVFLRQLSIDRKFILLQMFGAVAVPGIDEGIDDGSCRTRRYKFDHGIDVTYSCRPIDGCLVDVDPPYR